MSNESAAPEMVDISAAEIAGPEIIVADILPSEIVGPEIVVDISAAEIAGPEIIVADISPSEIAGPEIVADISAAEIADPEIVADISAAEIADPEIVADISAAEIASPEIAVGIDYGHTFLEEAVDEQDLESVSVCPSRDDLLSVVLDGNWDKVVEIVTNNPSWLHTGITDYGDSILHMAVIDMKVEVIQALINIDPSSLRYTSNGGSSAFFVAAASGLVEIAEMMMQQDEELPYIRGIYQMTPLHRAVALGHQSMVTYLLKVTNDWRLNNSDRIEILIWSITHDSFDVALDILEDHLDLALMRNQAGLTALHVLARRPLKIDGHQPSLWEILSGRFTAQCNEPKPVLKLAKMLWRQMVKQDKKEVYAAIQTPWPLLSLAVELGKVEFLTLLIRYYPPILSTLKDENGNSIVHQAVIHRQPEIFKLLYSEEYMQDFLVKREDLKQNNMLHLAGKLASRHSHSHVSGAALQMQRELQWFQAIKQCMGNNYIAAQNADKETPQDLFTKEHEELRKQGEEWMKKTAESCALVAALITTMVFSAAFQLPGGLNDSGSPVLVKNTSFVFFAMSNAVSLFTSTASILVFLSILTSRYAQRDFLKSLPLKLMIGQILLLISIATMVASFTVTFFIIFQQGLRWPPIVVAILASVPVTLFAFQQFPLLAEMYYSTYKFSNTLLPGQQRVFEGTSSRLLAYYGRTFATIHGRVRDANHED